MVEFSIPPEYQNQLELVDVVDTRTDKEILHALAQHALVTSEKKHLGVLALRHMRYAGIEDPSSPVRAVVPLVYKETIANHFVAARRGDPFIKRWHDVFTRLRKGHTNHGGLLESPLLALGPKSSLDEARASQIAWDFKVDVKTTMEYITQVLCWTRPTRL
ncbi:hypothetical protein B0H19DRAFT_1256644 [Mycena capillaripes]|nr:hypothetical protein B0H19DRAFT_1256644 [Mycena capillaripes]